MRDLAVILLVEDSEDDVFLIRRAFKQAYINNPLFVVHDGQEAMAYLSGAGKFGNRSEYPLPDLLLLDLKMPRVDGFEVLSWWRKEETLRGLRVVVLTSSDNMRDVNRAYALGASSFLVKPFDFQDILHLAKFLAGYWLQLNRPGTASRPAKPEIQPRAVS